MAAFVILLKGPSASQALTPREVFRRASESVLLVETLDAAGKPLKLGSAVVVVNGIAVTNAHVVEGSGSIRLSRPPKKWSANSFICDHEVDLCVLGVPELDARPAQIRSARQLEIGDRVYAIGSPQGLALTLSEGLISGKREDAAAGILLQTSAPISPGSSGGGLFDDEARLVGLTTLSIKESQNLNFAVPSDAIRSLLRRAALEAIAELYLAAKGGREVLATVMTVRQQGQIRIGDLSVPFTLEWKRPGLYRLEIHVRDSVRVSAFDSVNVWIRDFDGSVRQGDAVDVEDRLVIRDDALHFLDSIGLESRPAVDLLGVETVSGRRSYKLRLVEEGGSERTLFIDASKYLDLKWTRRFKVGALRFDATAIFANHKKINGVVFPLLTTVSLTSRSKKVPSRMAMSVESVWVNADIPDSRFFWSAKENRSDGGTDSRRQ